MRYALFVNSKLWQRFDGRDYLNDKDRDTDARVSAIKAAEKALINGHNVAILPISLLDLTPSTVSMETKYGYEIT